MLQKQLAPLQAGETLLHYAAARCNLDVIQCLLDNNADPLAKNGQGELPVEKASNAR